MQPNSQSSTRFQFLDVARGLAAVLVLLEHGLQACSPSYQAFALSNVITGQAAILVFFMISGFVIPMSLDNGKSLGKFWLRRCFRLLSVYWFSIGLGLLYVLFAARPFAVELSDAKSWLANVFLVQGWLQRPNVWGVYWSLHFEVVFYVLCTALFLLGLMQRAGARTFAALLVGFCAACIVKAIRTNNPTDDMYNWTIGLSALFGMIHYRYSTARVSRSAYFRLVALLVGVLATIWTVNHALHPQVAPWSQLLRTVWTGGLGFGTFIFLYEIRDKRWPSIFEWLGQRSYPIYLLHPFVLIVLTAYALTAWAFMVGLLLLTFAFAELVHRLVEQPGVDLGRRLERRRKATSDAIVRREPIRRAA